MFRKVRSALAGFLAVIMVLCAVPVAAFVPEMVEMGEEFAVEETNDTENDTGLFAQSVVSRDDGVWLFPADSKYYRAFTDFCGCLGNSTCPFHKLVHPYMTQASGWSNCHGWQTYSQGHNGFDVGVPNGSSVYAAASGYYHAISASSGGGRGAYVYIEHPISGSGYSYYSYYQHLSTVYTNLNNTYVQAGDLIGKSGNSGGSAYHLHFGIVLGKSGASASVLNNSECKGWLLSPGLAEGEIVANPSSSSPAGLPSSSNANDTRAIQDHCGSVRYTFNKNEVSIGANSNYQQFTPASINSGEYRLVNNGSYLTTTADNNTTVLTVKAKSSTSNQQFYISPNSRFSQSYIIKSQAYSSGRVVNVFTAGVSANGDNVSLYTSTTDASQSWRFEAKSGGYLIHPVDNTGLALTNSNGTVKVMTSSGASNQIWTLASAVDTYTVSYNANGGTGAPGNQTKTHGVSLTLSSVKPTKDGYTFQGWSTTLNGSVQYNPGSAYSGNANLTLYAVWNPVKYPIYFNANGGTGAPDTQYQTHFEYLTLSSVVPQRDGYTFQGWSTTLNGAVVYQPGNQFGENCSVTLYAVWTPCTYTISYDANGGENAPAAQTKRHGQSITITTDVPTRAGYTFKGWMGTRESGVVELVPGQVCDYNYSWTFYALWETTFPDQPQVNVESLTAPENIPFTVFWSPVKNADWYEVWLLSETETKNLEWQQTNTFYTTSLPAGNYTFQIVAINQERVNSGIDYANPGFASVTVKPIEDYIPRDKVEWNGHAYWIFDNYLSWGTARQFCEALGGHLATITSEGEENAIASSNALSTTSQIGFWLGGSDAEEEGTWIWLTGEDFTYSNWHPEGQPDNAALPHPWIDGLTVHENYLMIYSSKSPDFITTASQAYWNDFRSNTSSRDIGFICEFEPYVVSYNANGGEKAPTNQTKAHGVDMKLSVTVPTREGYAFQGWAVSKDGEVQYQPGDTYFGNANVTLYAVWQVLKPAIRIVNVVRSDGKLVCDLSLTAIPDGSTLCVAAYNGNKMIKVFTNTVSEKRLTVDLPNNLTRIKVFAVENMSTLKPVCESTEWSFAENEVTSCNIYNETLWEMNSSPVLYCNVNVEYKNRTEKSVQVRIVWKQSIAKSCFYGYAQEFTAVVGGVSTGTVTIIPLNMWGKSTISSNVKSRTVYSDWLDIPVTYDQTSVPITVEYIDSYSPKTFADASFTIPDWFKQ